MLISAKTTRPILLFFSPKEARLLFRLLQKLSARNIAALNARAEKPNLGYHHGTPIMHLKVPTTIQYLNFHIFPHLLIFVQFRDPSYVLNLYTKEVLQK